MSLFCPLFCLFNQVHQAFNFRPWGGKYAVALFIGVVVFQKLVNIHPLLPATDYPSTGKHVVLGAAVHKIDVTAHPGTSNRFVVVLLYQYIHLP